MRKKVLSALAAVGTALVLLVALAPGTTLSQQLQEVFVVNFPAVQEVSGEVEVAEPVPSSKLVAHEREEVYQAMVETFANGVVKRLR